MALLLGADVDAEPAAGDDAEFVGGVSEAMGKFVEGAVGVEGVVVLEVPEGGEFDVGDAGEGGEVEAGAAVEEGQYVALGVHEEFPREVHAEFGPGAGALSWRGRVLGAGVGARHGSDWNVEL